VGLWLRWAPRSGVGAGLRRLSLGRYLTSPNFAVDVTENWQSEYLQFTLYILGTVWPVQRGSPESKALSKAGLGSDQDQKVGRFTTADSPWWAKVGGSPESEPVGAAHSRTGVEG
jgi:hypothetical protein